MLRTVSTRCRGSSPPSPRGVRFWWQRFTVPSRPAAHQRASREEVQDPWQYQKWKDAKAKGEIDGVVLEDGRRLIDRRHPGR